MSERVQGRETPPSVVHGDRASSFREPGSLPTAAKRAGVALLASGVALNVWALTPSSDRAEQYVGHPDPSHPSDTELLSARDSAPVGAADPEDLSNAAPTELEDEVETSTPLHVQAASFPNLMTALSQVPIRAKLKVVLALLRADVEDTAADEAMEVKIRALLKLPDSVLSRLIEHPDLAEFSEMLDRTYLGESELWWIETQLDKIDVVPITTTSDRITVDGKPTYIYDSAASAQSGRDGRRAPELRSIPAPEPAQKSEFTARQPVTVEVPAADSAEPAFGSSSLVSLASSDSQLAPSDKKEEPSPAPTNAEVLASSGGPRQTTAHTDFDRGREFVLKATAALQAAFSPQTATSATPPASGPGEIHEAARSVDSDPPSGSQDTASPSAPASA